ncbi:hypothetical protein ACFQ0K_15050 [Nocardioides caeni]|uniref:Uncharacterized protein n=1 Tax=Nocardioides caeni TaxID=574700 RepID=A0A4S8NE03_9ACTN|nr:hypothetical protein [Nocardioides caeni]THV14678.1 hypothetical protein E9934_08460 [Nocardioides caeni]
MSLGRAVLAPRAGDGPEPQRPLGPLHRGRARRPGYAELAAASNYSERTVREAVAAMDGLLVLHRLADPDGPSDALDRVAQALRLHSALLGGD